MARKLTLVIIESPYAGDVQGNVKYAQLCLLDSLRRGEAPFASHLLYPQVLPDHGPDRDRGIQAGLSWGLKAKLTAVYTDRGISPGMRIGIDAAKAANRRVEYRSIYDRNPKHFQETDHD